MAVTKRPGSNVNTLWDTYDYTNIDDAVSSPTASGDSDYIVATDSNEDDIQKYSFPGFDPTASFATVTSIQAYVRCKDIGGRDPEFEVSVYFNSTEQTKRTISMDEEGSFAWFSPTAWTGSWAASSVSGIQLWFDASGRNPDFQISVAYIVVDGTPAAGGAGMPFFLPSGDTARDLKGGFTDVWTGGFK